MKTDSARKKDPKEKQITSKTTKTKTDLKEEEEKDTGLMYDMLKDPLQDRKIKDLPLPPSKPMRDEVLFVGMESMDMATYLKNGK